MLRPRMLHEDEFVAPFRTCRPAVMLAMSLALVQGCQIVSPDLRADFDPGVDFSKYRSFKFVQLPSVAGLGFPPFVTEQLLSSVANQMTLRGYQWEQSYPDLLINVYAKPNKRRRSQPSFAYYDYRYYGTWPGYQMHDIYTTDYDPGTLNIDLIDASRMQMVWEGRGIGLLTSSPPKDRSREYDAEIRQAVQQIFDGYPFRAGDARAYVDASADGCGE
jgi:hypothetical protein